MRGVGKTVGKVLDNPITPIVASSLLGPEAGMAIGAINAGRKVAKAVRGRGKLFQKKLDQKPSCGMRSRVMRYAKELERNGMSKSEACKTAWKVMKA